MPRRGRDGARGLRDAAADRRRDHVSASHTAVKIEPRTRRRSSTCPTRRARSAWRRAARRRRAATRFVAGDPRGIRERPRASARAGATEQSPAPRSRRRARNRLAIDWTGADAADADVPRRADASTTTRSRSWSTGHRLDAVLPDLGAAAALIRAILDDPRPGAAARDALRRRAGAARPHRRRAAADAPAASSASGRPTRSATTSSSTPTRRGRELAPLHTLRQQMAKPTAGPNLALADFVAPRETGVADYVGAFAVTAGHGADELVAGVRGAQHDDYNAIMAKALARPAGRGLRRAAARAGPPRALGLRARRDADQRRPHRRALPGHPPGAGLPAPARPHREADAVRAARRRGARPASR